ncbi:MAG: hypothetical protein AAF196_04340 [Planctomycetota bacterium]
MNRFSPVAFAAAALLATPVFAQQLERPSVPTSPTGLFPSSTMAVFEFSGLEACAAAAENDALLSFIRQRFAEEMGQDPIEMVSGMALGELDGALEQIGVSRSDVRQLLRSRIAFGASRLSFFDEDEPMPALALAIEAKGNTAAVVERVADQLFDLMISQVNPGIDLQRSSRTVQGTQLDIVKPRAELGSIGKAMVGDWMVLTSSESFLVDIVETANNGQRTVSDAKGLAWARDNGGESLASLWLNIGPFFDALGLILPYEADPILEALGLNRLNGIMLDYSELPSGAGQDTLSIAADHTEDGVLAALVQGDLDMSVARYFPETTFAFGTVNLDSQKILQAFGGLIDALPGEARAEILEGFAEMSEELGAQGMSLDGVRNTVAQIGNQVAFGINVQGGAIPDGLFFLGTRREGFAEMIADLVQSQGMEVREQTLEDVGTVRYLSVPDLPISPAFVEVDGGLLFGTSPNVVKGAVRRAKSGEGCLTGTEDFQSNAQPAADVAGMFHLRMRAVGPSVYANFLPLLKAGIRQEGAPFDPDMLPDADELEDLLEDVSLVISRDPGGIRVRGSHQFSTAQILSWVGSVLDEMMSTGLGEVR